MGLFVYEAQFLFLCFLENNVLAEGLAVFLELDLSFDLLLILAGHVDFASFLIFDLNEVNL